MNDSDGKSEAGATPASGWGYLAAVGVLLTLIVVMLAVLVVRERSRRVDAQKQLVEHRRRLADIQNAVGHMLTQTATATPIDREAMVSQTVQIDGHERTALYLGATAGQRLGLAPGDVLIVGELVRPPTGPVDAQGEAETQPSEPSIMEEPGATN